MSDPKAEFERLLAELRPKLHRYCARMTGSSIDGEDVLQETLVKAIEAFPHTGPLANAEGSPIAGNVGAEAIELGVIVLDVTIVAAQITILRVGVGSERESAYGQDENRKFGKPHGVSSESGGVFTASLLVNTKACLGPFRA